MDTFNSYYTNKNLDVSLGNISSVGKQTILNIVSASPDIGTVSSVNNILPVNKNITLSLDSISDVQINNLQNLDILANNNGNWVNTALQMSMEELSDVIYTAIENNQFLRYDSTDLRWKNVSLTSDMMTQGIINIFYQNSLVSDYLLTILTATGSLLARNTGGNLDQISLGANGTFLSVDTGALSWKTISEFTDVKVSTYLLSILTTNEDLLLRRGDALIRVAKGANDTVLSVDTDGTIKWKAPASTTTTLSALTDCTITTPADNNILRYDNATSKWVNSIPNTSYIVEQTNQFFTILRAQNAILDILTTDEDILIRKAGALTRQAKGADNQVLTTNGTGNVVWADPASGDKTLDQLTDVVITTVATGEILRKTATDWTNQTLDTSIVPENGTNVYYSTTKQDTQYKTYYTEKGQILAGTGNQTYTALTVGTSDNQTLFTKSTATNGIEWRQPRLLDCSDTNITAPANNNTLVYNNVTGKWTNGAVIPIFPLRSTISGTQAAPALSFAASTGTGMYINAGPTSLNFAFNGADVFWCFPQALQILTSQGILNRLGTTTLPSYAFNSGNNDSGFSCPGNTNIHSLISGVSRHDISAIRTRIPTRLDVVDTEYRNNSIRINNPSSVFYLQNSDGSQDHLKVDIPNDRVNLPRNRWGEAYLPDNFVVVTSITINNQLTPMNLDFLGTTIQVTNSPNVSLISYTNGNHRIKITKTGSYLVNVSFSAHTDKNTTLFDIIPYRLVDGVAGASLNGHRRTRCDSNFYINYTASFVYTATNALGQDEIAWYIRTINGATLTFTLCNFNCVFTNLLTS